MNRTLKPFAYAFRLEGVDEIDPEDPPACIAWISRCNLKADDLLRRPHQPRNREAIAEAVAFLEGELANGPKLSDEINKRAKELGISEPTLKRARKEVGVHAGKREFQGDWYVWIGDDDPKEQSEGNSDAKLNIAKPKS